MAANSKPKRFLARVYKIWMMRHIDVAEEVSTTLMKEFAKSSKGSRSSQRRQRELHAGNARQTANDGSARGEASKLKYIPVVAVVNGRSARITLVPAGGGRFRMQINTALRKAARVDVGDLVNVELRLDLQSRDLPVPADLRGGLRTVPKAWKAFQALTPAHRRHMIQYFDSAKSAEARQRRIERIIDVLLERALLKPNHRLARTARTAPR